MRRSILIAAVLTAVLSVAACGGKQEQGGGGAGGPPGGMQLPVETVTVQPQALQGGLQTVGSLRADESVVVRPEVGGRVTRIHFTEGGRVAAGQPLFTLDGSLAQASLNEATANLENSRRALARAAELSAQKLISQSDLDKARAQFGVDQARVASARTALSKMTLRAPFSGQVGLRGISVGEFVNVGQDLVTLVKLDPIEVDFSVPETALTQLRNGQKIAITVDAFPGDAFDGQVVAIDPVIDPNSRSAKLRARIPNPDFRLRPGQFAMLKLDTGTGDANALMVPEQALMQDGDTRFVYVVVDGKAKKTTVRTGTRTPGLVQVVEGLKAGDVVITAGQAKPMMHDGMAVMSLPPQSAGEGAVGGKPGASGTKAPAAKDGPAKADATQPASGG
ncbi:efflux RND transporter periplasmic adaptor subunit [Aerolutibacter ruishenii]|uniref:Membrane fusion protein (Multidrug efflux system) n=1 Tax=Aerolutibacter ruishenii TaxID=686800 RepID=A0A562LRV2_9GAMM|nr:efflux RND transporter periplasmic adaptor subunit [Lysobacter ruishenii]TWI10293.1 membrane fusion protein (multidrug efflux system) [Lysobacter ruishenii]